MINNTQNKKGFTIIETLVAITVLMIAIAGPLTIAQKGLLASVYARDQMIASFLAQDGMEYARNVRYYNIINSLDWLRGLSDCIQTNPCSIDTLNARPTDASPLGVNRCIDDDCPLYLVNNDGGYTPESSNANITQFKRSFYVENNPLIPDRAIFYVIVSWGNGDVENRVVFQNEVYNVRI